MKKKKKNTSRTTLVTKSFIGFSNPFISITGIAWEIITQGD